MNDDFRDILAELLEAGARFLVVGAHAMAVHGVPRATGDLDVWIDTEGGNAHRVWTALVSFGAPVETLGITIEDLITPGMVVQLGLPPRRIDILTQLTGLTFEESWTSRVIHEVEHLKIPFLGKAAFIENKRAVGRAKDLADIESLNGE